MPQGKSKKRVWERLVPRSQATREWDIDFWQAQNPSTRFLTAWHMVIDFYKMKGKRINENTFRLQRSVEHLQRKRR